MSADCLDADLDETDVLLTRACANHVRDLVVAGRSVVSGAKLAEIDLSDAEAELMAMARSAAARDPGQFMRGRRSREALRACYADARHLT